MDELGQVDWGRVGARPGQHACPVHGLVQPRPQLVPACPACGRAVHRAVRDPAAADAVVWQELTPRTCAGPERHPLGPGTVLVGSQACTCHEAGMHRTWTCGECGDRQMWPPHDETNAAPYLGPGWRG